MKKKPLIPFRIMPASWGLTGQAYDEAEAAYTLSGRDLDIRLVDIRVTDSTERRKQLLAIDLRYDRISAYDHDIQLAQIEGRDDAVTLLELEARHGRITEQEFEARYIELVTPDEEKAQARLTHRRKHDLIEDYEYDLGVAKLVTDEKEREIAVLDVELKHGKMTERAHEKAVATVREEPWVGVIDDGFDLNRGLNGLFFELDWNSYWIDYLRLNGYGGANEEAVLKAWFADVCMATVYEAEAAEGNLDPFQTSQRSHLRDPRYRS